MLEVTPATAAIEEEVTTSVDEETELETHEVLTSADAATTPDVAPSQTHVSSRGGRKGKAPRGMSQRIRMEVGGGTCRRGAGRPWKSSSCEDEKES